MTLANGVIYAASKDQTLYGIDAETGTEVFSFPLDGLVDFGPAVLDGVAYVGTIRGILYAIGGSQEPVVQAHASTGSPIASPSAAEVISAELAWSTENLEGLDQPAVVSFAPDGSIWVLDFADLEVFVFSSSGELIERLGGRKPPAISSRRQPGERWHSHPSAPSTRSTPRI
jgi:hypothetical protein